MFNVLRTPGVVPVLVLLCLAAPAPCCAICFATPGDVRAQGKETPEYVLGAEDTIEISVRNHSSLNRTITIQPDGRVNVPEVGEIEAAGKTPKALARQIQAELERTLNNVLVVVTVKEIHSRRVRVVGAVKAPAMYDLRPNWRLLDIVAMAGGLTTKPNRVDGRVIHADSRLVPINMVEALARPDSSANVLLEPDDMIVLDELDPIRNQAHVIGAVPRPGAFDLDPETNIIALLSQAGGPGLNAALSKAYVLRGATKFPMNLRPIVEEGKTDEAIAKFRLQPGDVLFIPEIEVRFVVAGMVGKPGYYAFPENGKMTVLQAYYQAGGPIPGATDQAHAAIIRTVAGKTTSIPINIDSMLKRSDLASNIGLQPNDVLYVPGRGSKHGLTLQDAFTPFSLLGFLGLRLFR